MILRTTIAVLALSCLLPGMAAAATTTEWIDTVTAEKTAAEMREKKMRLIALDCRPDEAATATVFSMVWEPNDDNRQWSWREGTVLDIKTQLREFDAKGFEVVSRKDFAMPGRSDRACVLWHR